MATQRNMAGGHAIGFGATTRTDNWWVEPLVTGTVFLSFIVYTTWAALQGEYYYAAPYLSPFYAPLLLVDPTAPGSAPVDMAWFGAWPSWWPWFIPASPAVLILALPGSFRFTCYYYRKAYYRSLVGSPPACAVGPLGQRRYGGETGILVLQNIHRYAMYFAVIFVFLLAYEALIAFFHEGKFGVGVGTIILVINAILIGGYTFGCHSFRHMVGGHSDCMSCGKNTLRHNAWKGATWFNNNHMAWAWASLVWVMIADVYIRLMSMGYISDLNTWGI